MAEKKYTVERIEKEALSTLSGLRDNTNNRVTMSKSGLKGYCLKVLFLIDRLKKHENNRQV